VVVGDGPEEFRLRLLARQLAVDDRTQFVGWVERSQLSTLYQTASVFLYPSHEGAGMVVVEALAAGLPIVCFKNSGPGELADDSCAVRIPYQRYDAAVAEFAGALEKLRTSGETREALSRGARRRFESEFSWGAKGRRLQSIYRRVLP